MPRPTIATLFGGFGGVEMGSIAAGLQPTWSIELDPAIAEVARANLGRDIHVGNILACDPRKFAPVDVLHASPPCPSFSVASQGCETALDIALSRKVAEFVTVLCPPVVTLENVWAYRHSKSWRIVEDALHEAGYWVSVEHINTADHGVPQTRKRMIVRAVQGGFVPYLPEPVPWVGWYAAVEDLLDTLPDSQFAPWQLARLPQLLQTVLVGQNGYEGGIITRDVGRPSPTVTANHNQLGIKAFLMQVQGEGGDGVRWDSEPMQTVAANHGAGKYRAFLVGDQERQIAAAEDPAFTVRSGGNGGALPRALLLPGGGNTNFAEAHPGKGCRYEHEPSHTVPAISSEGGAMPKAWLVDGANTTEDQLSLRRDDQPALTVTTGGPKHPTRALLEQGRVVSITPRALARFQSFPDDFELPDNARLAAKGIGNAIPPLLYARIIAPLVEDFL